MQAVLCVFVSGFLPRLSCLCLLSPQPSRSHPAAIPRSHPKQLSDVPKKIILKTTEQTYIFFRWESVALFSIFPHYWTPHWTSQNPQNGVSCHFSPPVFLLPVQPQKSPKMALSAVLWRFLAWVRILLSGLDDSKTRKNAPNFEDFDSGGEFIGWNKKPA